MKNILAIAILSLAVVATGFAQNNKVQGPKYKNTKPSERNEGNSELLMKENPNQLQGPEYKNYNPSKYATEVIEPVKPEAPNSGEMVVSTENKNYKVEEQNQASEKEVIIYKRVETNEMEGKNKKGLKGPAYKNYKPNR